MPTATKAIVRINSIHVLNSSVSTTAEPGSYAEWYMTFVVNGQVATWSSEHVRDDQVYAINREIVVDLAPNETLFIKCSGYEQDDTSANDVLPTAERAITPSEDFQLGGTLSISSQESVEGTYTVQVSIRPAMFAPGDVGETHDEIVRAREFVGVYRPGSGRYGLWAANWAGFTKKWDEWSKAGLRLERIATFRQDTGAVSFGDTTQRMFVGSFGEGNDKHALWVSEWPSFEAKWEELSAAGLRLVDVSVYQEGSKRMFAGVYRGGSGGYALWVAEWPSFEAKWKQLTSGGLRLVALDSYLTTAGKRVYVGVYRAGAGAHALHQELTWKALMDKATTLRKQGLLLTDLASYSSKVDGTRFLAAFGVASGGQSIVRNAWDDLAHDWAQRTKLGSRLVCLDAFTSGMEE